MNQERSLLDLSEAYFLNNIRETVQGAVTMNYDVEIRCKLTV